MPTFDSLYGSDLLGKLCMADRLIFKGHLTGLFHQGAFARFLSRQGVLLKDFASFAEQATAELKAHLQALAAAAQRPYRYLEGAHTHASGHSKEDIAREILAQGGVPDGLICILATVEPCRAFTVRAQRETHRLEAILRPRKCLHFYLYYLHPDFGFMHVRIQSWFPFQVQIYINGREWLARQLDRKGISYQRFDNALLEVGDLAYATQRCQRFFKLPWHKHLDRLVAPLNPWISRISKAGFGSYYWVVDQCEIATDLMWKSRAALGRHLPRFIEHAVLELSAEDTLRFLGRKPNGNLKGEVTSSLKRRPEGYRVKFRMRRNSIKMYDKHSVLRIETTINNPGEFKVWRTKQGSTSDAKPQQMPMRKGVADFWRFLEVAQQANERFLQALAEAVPTPAAVQALEEISKPHRRRGRQIPRFNPVTTKDLKLFLAAMIGDHLLNGFRNRDLRRCLYRTPSRTRREDRRRCERVSRLIAKLRGHGLIRKVPGCRLYRVTAKGQRTMSAAIRFRCDHIHAQEDQSSVTG
jgi:hypothetical protein